MAERENDSLDREIRDSMQDAQNAYRDVKSAVDAGKKLSEAARGGAQAGAGSAGAGSTGAGAAGAGAQVGVRSAAAGASAGTGTAGAGAAGAASTGAGARAAAGAASTGAGAGAAAGTAGAGSGAGAGAAAGTPPGAIALGVVIALLVIFVIVNLLIVQVVSIGTPSTSTNSMSHVNEIQDPVDEDELHEDGSVDGFADGKSKAKDAEAEGVNLIYKVLKEEEVSIYKDLKKEAKKNGVDYNTTKAFLTKAETVPSGSAIFAATDGQKNDDNGYGYYTQDQIDACEILSTYSISVDNLWGKDYLGDGTGLNIPLDSIDISTVEGKAKYMYVRLRNEGYSHNAACGMLGNIQRESNFNQNEVNSIGATGIVQWYQGRATKMKAAVKKSHGKWNDYKGQVEYMVKELKTYKKVNTTLVKPNVSLEDATWVIMRYYENPGNYQSEQKIRLKYAQEWSKKFQSLSAETTISASSTGAAAITKMAIACAWPYGTKKSVYGYPNGRPTDAYKAALQKAYGARKGWGKQPKAGASCDVFVGTVVRASGYDTKFPRGLDGVQAHCKKYKNKWTNMGSLGPKQWQPGDVIFQLYKGGGGHIYIYIGDGKVANAHYNGKAYGIVEKATSIYHKNNRVSNVYRPTGAGGGAITLAVAGSSGSSGSSGSGGAGVKGALAWAEKTANDNSYTYGGARCHQCSSKNPKKYVCTTFVKAAYGHGAGDAEMLKWCKSGANGFVEDLHPQMKKSSNWKSLGKISQSQMQPGDVIFWKGHVELYYGNGKRIGAHNSSLPANDQVSVKAMYGGYHDVMRYVGKGGGGSKTYDKFTIIKKLDKKDLEQVVSSEGTGLCPTAQSMAYMGNNEYAICLNDVRGNSGGTKAFIRTYKGGRKTGTSKVMNLGHANGMAYKPDEKMLYSVDLGGNHTCKKIDAGSLKRKGDVKMQYGAGSIAFDTATKRFSLGQGASIRVLSGANVTDKSKKTVKKKGMVFYSQDHGAANGVLYTCATNKHTKNYIGMYSEDSGDYYGSYALTFDAEIEDCEVDEEGHLLILIHKKGTRHNYIYRTKEALAVGAGGEGAAGDDQSGNWRVHMPAMLRAYMQEMKAGGKNPLYRLDYVVDEKGNPKHFTGVYDASVLEEDPKAKGKIEADGKSKGVVVVGKHKIRNATEEEVKEYEQRLINNNMRQEAANEQAKANADPKLKKGSYIKATLKKKSVIKLGFEAFGVTNEKVRELYGSYSEGTDTVEDMALNSLALLHDVNDFGDEYKVDPDYADVVESDGLNYELGKELGTFRVYFACFCGREECTKHLARLGITSVPRDAKPGVTCYTSDTKKLKIGTMIHTTRLGPMVVEGSVPNMTKSKKPYLVLYLGKQHKSAIKMMRYVQKVSDKAHSFTFRIVTKVTTEEVKEYGNLVTGGAGGWVWPTTGKTVTSTFGGRASPGGIGSTNHKGIDIGVSVGTDVFASKAGTVTRAGSFGGYGNCVDIDHGNGWSTRYGHLSKILVKKGDTVTQGQVIAKSGNTGNSTGPHLHFEIQQNGTAVDPLKYVKK